MDAGAAATRRCTGRDALTARGISYCQFLRWLYCQVYRSMRTTKWQSENSHAGLTTSAAEVSAEVEAKTIATTSCREQAVPPSKGKGCGPWRPGKERLFPTVDYYACRYIYDTQTLYPFRHWTPYTRDGTMKFYLLGSFLS